MLWQPIIDQTLISSLVPMENGSDVTLEDFLHSQGDLGI